MTKTVEASPELDAQVAVEVMRWEIRQQRGGCCIHIPGKRGFDAGPWSPSTDWAAAGEVLERFDLCNVESDGPEAREIRWQCCLFPKGGTVCAYAPTGPLAICLAALAAVRAKGDNHAKP